MHSHYKLMILLLVAAVMISPLLFGAPINPVHAPHAMVVSQHELASRAGVEIMQAGGNAVDASVATGFALAVVHPPAGNLGGGAFMLLRTADGNVHFIDYRATRLNSSHRTISYAVFCLKKKKKQIIYN